ncbi:diguanylate cyclase domain-containing protein [Paucibacter soli]|uniref:diguanylate cyclase domain-containing protein n=1 Tax=Paucibacter soli TaxID=3133433 RepID=UPI0030AA250D
MPLSAPHKLSEPSPAASRAAGPSSLVRRLTLLNLLVLSLTMLLTFAFIAEAFWLAARERQQRAAELSAMLLASNLAPMLAFEDGAAAQVELQAFARRGDLRLVQVLRTDGSSFASWAPGPAPAAAPGALGEHELEVWAAVQLKGENIGSIRLRESLQQLRQFAWQMSLMGLVLILLAILVAAWVLGRVQRRALAPIVELSRLADRVARQRDYGLRATVRRPDEVGRLAERFNAMLKRIEVWQGELNEQLHQEQVAGQQLQQLAHRDTLTQLPNRLFFQSELQRQVGHAVQAGELMALMFIDLDNFKTVNDSHGHEAGDAVLREMAQRMASVLRSTDLLCRLGGDEFALLLPGLADAAAAEHLAERLIAAVRAPLHVRQQLMPVGATVGLAFCPQDSSDPAELLKLADQAMYEAKRAGKNTYRRAGNVDE